MFFTLKGTPLSRGLVEDPEFGFTIARYREVPRELKEAGAIPVKWLMPFSGADWRVIVPCGSRLDADLVGRYLQMRGDIRVTTIHAGLSFPTDRERDMRIYLYAPEYVVTAREMLLSEEDQEYGKRPDRS